MTKSSNSILFPSLLLTSLTLPLWCTGDQGGKGKSRQTWEVPHWLVEKHSNNINIILSHLDWLPLVHLGDHWQVEDHRVKQVHQVAPKNQKVKKKIVSCKQRQDRWAGFTSPPPSPGVAGSLSVGWSPSFAGDSCFSPPIVGSWRDRSCLLDETLLFSVAALVLATVFQNPILALATSSMNCHLSVCLGRRLCWEKSALSWRWMWQKRWQRQSSQSLASPCPTAACLIF